MYLSGPVHSASQHLPGLLHQLPTSIGVCHHGHIITALVLIAHDDRFVVVPNCRPENHLPPSPPSLLPFPVSLLCPSFPLSPPCLPFLFSTRTFSSVQHVIASTRLHQVLMLMFVPALLGRSVVVAGLFRSQWQGDQVRYAPPKTG